MCFKGRHYANGLASCTLTLLRTQLLLPYTQRHQPPNAGRQIPHLVRALKSPPGNQTGFWDHAAARMTISICWLMFLMIFPLSIQPTFSYAPCVHCQDDSHARFASSRANNVRVYFTETETPTSPVSAPLQFVYFYRTLQQIQYYRRLVVSRL